MDERVRRMLLAQNGWGRLSRLESGGLGRQGLVHKVSQFHRYRESEVERRHIPVVRTQVEVSGDRDVGGFVQSDRCFTSIKISA
jgi:hypothetical protein